jgi:histidyl-tRNA synthetase
VEGDRRIDVRAPTGTHDVLWPESWHWENVVSVFAGQAERAGYGLVITPVFEYAEVFRRGIGAESDVVGKEMYEFEDRDGRWLALRPEGTASIVRCFLDHHPTAPWKAWYVTPAFRHERPQAGRYRQHHQLGIEAIGSPDPDLDVEVVWLAREFVRSFGLRQVDLHINSMGDANCRPAYVERLRSVLFGRKTSLCEEHRSRIEKNPLRVLDCKTVECRDATADIPKLMEELCDQCAAHFDRVCTGLAELGVEFTLDHRLVRGFDYYTRTTFEMTSSTMAAAQNAVGGGGRYDGLVEMMGGPPTPGIGFGIGIERFLLALGAEGHDLRPPDPMTAFVVDVAGGGAARDLTAELRRAGIRADRAFDDRSMKAQMKLADRSGAQVALIVGPEEVENGVVTVRDLRTGAPQRVVLRSQLIDEVGAIVGPAGGGSSGEGAARWAEVSNTRHEGTRSKEGG